MKPFLEHYNNNRFVEEDHRASTHHMLKQRVMRMVSGMLSLWVVTVTRVDVQKHDFNADASDYKLLKDVGFWLPQSIKKLNMVKNLKYIGNKIHNSFSPLFNSFLDIVNSFLHFLLLDPTYMIRVVQPMHQTMFTDTLLAWSVVHGAIAGYTEYTSDLINGRPTNIPYNRITEKQNNVVITG
ncbi:unnamed protein product [Brassica rapa subsp. narinosa]|uniref:(rape) hypothetical protein n=1 Tax=Brassica napus TaxID=3708 RepID=A0A816X7T3_BRANA|nr:unnamed protein product [Brassica napus]